MVDRLANLEKRVSIVERKLQDNTDTCDAIKRDTGELRRDTGELLDLFRASKAGVRIVKWMVTVCAAGAGGWAAFKGLAR